MLERIPDICWLFCWLTCIDFHSGGPLTIFVTSFHFCRFSSFQTSFFSQWPWPCSVRAVSPVPAASESSGGPPSGGKGGIGGAKLPPHAERAPPGAGTSSGKGGGGGGGWSTSRGTPWLPPNLPTPQRLHFLVIFIKYLITAKTKPPFWGVLYLFWV